MDEVDRLTGPSVDGPDDLHRRLREAEAEVERLRAEQARDAGIRERAEEAIGASERRYRALFEESLDAIVVTTLDGRVIDLNQATVELMRAESRDQAMKVDVADYYVHPEARERFLERLKQDGFVRGYEIELRRFDGSHLIAIATSVPLRDADGTVIGIRNTLRDVTAEHRLRRELSQAQKMEAVGRLAGGVAHEFNNLLTAIVGHGELLSGAVGDDPELRPHVDGIRQAARRGANLTQRLLAFGRRQIARPIRLDLNDAVGRMRQLLRRAIGEQIVLDITLGADPATVEADLSQIEQVIVNLALNARDAMPEGGSLRITTFNRTVDATEGAGTALAAGQHVVLGVEDTGIGIDEEIRDLIFEPFFTTKAGDGGTGLGLAAVHGIVTRSGGCVQVRSSTGRGTTFEISWPIAAAPEPEPVAELAISDTDVVLVVDDDPGVRSLASKVLAGQGYLTLEAADGEEAVALFAQQAGRVGVLVSDVVMPGLQGPELAARLRGVDPDLKVVLMSGYTEASSDSVGSMLEPGMRFLQKPFSPADLVALVRDVSDPD